MTDTDTLPAELAKLAGRFEAYLGGNPKLSAHTRNGYVSRIRQYLTWLDSAVLDGVDGDALRAPAAADHAVHEYRRWMLTAGKRSGLTVNAHMTACVAFYSWLGIAVHPQRVDVVPNRRSLEPDERRRFDAHVDTNSAMTLRDRTILRTLRYTGVRLDELCALDLDDALVTARSGLVDVRYGKGGKARKIPAPPLLRPTLVDYRQHRAGLGDIPADVVALFLSNRRRRISPDAVARVVSAVGDAVGIKDLTPHVLRHTYAKELAEANVPKQIIAILLGHGGTVTDLYTLPDWSEIEAEVFRVFEGRR